MRDRWDSLGKSLHWCVALSILITVPAGYVMSSTYGPSFKDAGILQLHLLASQIHHTLGILTLAAAIVWITRRLLRGRPMNSASPMPQLFVSRVVHFGLLALLILIPWSGWTALSSLADSPQFGKTHLWFFTADGLLPRIWMALPFDDPAGYAQFARWHIWGLWAGLGLVSLHLLAALWHHFIRRDSVLRRMWPLG